MLEALPRFHDSMTDAARSLLPFCLAPRHLVHSLVDEATQQAYLETHYRVIAPALVLRIGEPCPELVQFHQERNVTCSTFITADNPLGVQLSESQNSGRRRTLLAELDKRKLAWVHGAGQHPNGQWPAEHSVLVLGLGLDGARSLAERMEQNAVVWMDTDAVPRLLMVR